MTPALLSLLLTVLSQAVTQAAPDKPQAEAILTCFADELARLPEPDQQALLKHQMIMAMQQAQTALTQKEAAHRSVFAAGWRPLCGRACSLAAVWLFFGAPVMTAFVSAFWPVCAGTVCAGTSDV